MDKLDVTKLHNIRDTELSYLPWVQSTALTVTLQSAGLIDAGSIFSAIVAILSIVTGTVFLMWLGEQITERGIGNGISLLIATSIIVGVPRAFGQALEQAQQGLSLIHI